MSENTLTMLKQAGGSPLGINSSWQPTSSRATASSKACNCAPSF